MIPHVVAEFGETHPKFVRAFEHHFKKTIDEFSKHPGKTDTCTLAMLDGNGKATRVGFRVEDGKKVRYAKTTGEAI